MQQPTDYRKMVLDTIANALTSDPNPEVRAKAAESLGKLGDQTVTPLLLIALYQVRPINLRITGRQPLST